MPESKDAAIEETVQRTRMEGVDAGIVSVMLGEDGNVVGYAALAAPEETKDTPRNTVAVAMMDALECPESTRRITPGEPTQENARLVRHYKVKPPMDVPSFITAAMANQAMDNAFATTLRDKVRTIASGRSPY